MSKTEVTCSFSVMDLVHLCGAKMTTPQRQLLDAALGKAEVPATPAHVVVGGILSGNHESIVHHHVLQLVKVPMTCDELLDLWDVSTTMSQAKTVKRVHELCRSSLGNVSLEPSWLQAKMNEPSRSDNLRQGLLEVLRANFFHCPICLSWVHPHQIRSCSSHQHSWCSACVLAWASEPNQIAAMSARRRLQLPCHSGCHIPEEIIRSGVLPW
eukprot:Skav207293  [mRNA]  locus=scaffold1463:69180:85946:- [translate_table: standard]